MRWIAISCLALVLAAMLFVPVSGAQSSEYGKVLQIHMSPQGSGYGVASLEVMYGKSPNHAIRSGNLRGVVLDAGGKELQAFTFQEPGTTEGDILGPEGENSLIGFAARSPRSDLTITLPYLQDMRQFTLTDTTAGTIPVRADLNGPVASFCTDYPQDPDCLLLRAPPQTTVPESGSYLYPGALFLLFLITGTGIFIRSGVAAGLRAGKTHSILRYYCRDGLLFIRSVLPIRLGLFTALNSFKGLTGK